MYPRDGDLDLGVCENAGALLMYAAREMTTKHPAVTPGQSGNVLVLAYCEEAPFGQNERTQSIGGGWETICPEKGRWR